MNNPVIYKSLYYFLSVLLLLPFTVKAVENTGTVDFQESVTNYFLIPDQYDNYGLIRIRSDVVFSSGSSPKLINHASGRIVFTGDFFDLYNPDSVFENKGSAYFLSGGFALIRGKIINRNLMIFDANTANSRFYCDFDNTGLIINEGKLIITQGTECKLRDNHFPAKARLLNLGGSLVVNGILGDGSGLINSLRSTISGNGTMKLAPGSYFGGNTFSPGDPIGTLTLESDIDLFCLGCSVDIELAGPDKSDHLQVNSDFYMHSWNLNVMLREGYIPEPGTQFTIIAANLVYFYGQQPTYNLPPLPDGRTWDIQNTGTEVILTAN